MGADPAGLVGLGADPAVLVALAVWRAWAALMAEEAEWTVASWSFLAAEAFLEDPMFAVTKMEVSMKRIGSAAASVSIELETREHAGYPKLGEEVERELGRENVLPRPNFCADNAETGQLSHWQLEDGHLHSIELAFEVSSTKKLVKVV